LRTAIRTNLRRRAKRHKRKRFHMTQLSLCSDKSSRSWPWPSQVNFAVFSIFRAIQRSPLSTASDSRRILERRLCRCSLRMLSCRLTPQSVRSGNHRRSYKNGVDSCTLYTEYSYIYVYIRRIGALGPYTGQPFTCLLGCLVFYKAEKHFVKCRWCML
jgi:hypothetical protein